MAHHARESRSAVADVGLNDPLDPVVALDTTETGLPRRVWVLLDAEHVPVDGLDHATPEELQARFTRPVAANDPSLEPVPTGTTPPRTASQPVPAGWVSVETAAMSLDTTPDALRKRLNRAARRDRHGVHADLNGIEGRQIGGSWRLRFSGVWRSER